MGKTISFGGLAVRAASAVKNTAGVTTSATMSNLAKDAGAIDFDDLVFAAGKKKNALMTDIVNDLKDDGQSFVVGDSPHIQAFEFFAIVADKALKSSDFKEGGLKDSNGNNLSGQLHKLSDTNYGGRLTGDNGTGDPFNRGKIGDISGSGMNNDPIAIQAFGRTSNNNTYGNVEVRYDNNNGFGAGSSGNGEGATRFLDGNESIKFTLNKSAGVDQAIQKVSFTVTNTGGNNAKVGLSFGDGLLKGYETSGPNKGKPIYAADFFEIPDVKNGDMIEIDFALQTIKINGVAQVETMATKKFFADFIASGHDAISIGATSGRFSIGDLSIDRMDDPMDDPKTWLSLDAFAGRESPLPGVDPNKTYVYAYLDQDNDNILDGNEAAEELASISNGVLRDSDGSTDANPLQGAGNSTGSKNSDLLDIYIRGQADANSPSGHQDARLKVAASGTNGSFSMSIDTAAPADVVIPGGPNGSPADINPGSGNYGDEGATSGAKFINDGELVGFVLKANDASKGVVSYANGFDTTPATMNDIIIRLYSDDTLIETINHDVTGAPGSIMFSDDAGKLFNRVEVEAGAGVRFNLTDADFLLV